VDMVSFYGFAEVPQVFSGKGEKGVNNVVISENS